jgi:hypothetical protein
MRSRRPAVRPQRLLANSSRFELEKNRKIPFKKSFKKIRFELGTLSITYSSELKQVILNGNMVYSQNKMFLKGPEKRLHCEKRLTILPSPAGMLHQPNSSWPGII